ncbi:MAG TPA: serine/threonine-protein kinase, partial [Haliangium sp.]|nr:serine/threonine-protein kinase [Haliangium sp.]
DDGFFYFVMDFIPGGNLQDAVLEGRVHREQAITIMLSVGEALAQAHARGHVHRDVKPVNILLTTSGEPRLTDFDLVTAQDTTGGTRTGALGTFLYAAPEMMERPQDADARADVYGLGMTVAFVLHGDRLPRTALTARARFIDELSCPPALKGVLKKATAEDAAHRHPDTVAFCEALTVVNLSESQPALRLPASGLSTPPDEMTQRLWITNLSDQQIANYLDISKGTKHSAAKRRTPWSGYWYVNVNDEGNRSWADQRKFGFVTAGGGLEYSRPLFKLKVGNPVFAYLRGEGYVGYGLVRSEAVRVLDAQVNGTRLLDLPLERPGIANKYANDPERSEYIVGIDWKATVKPADAKTFKGVFTYRNVVCRLREKETIEFLKREFGVQE